MARNALAFTITAQDSGSRVILNFGKNVAKVANQVETAGKGFSRSGEKAGAGMGKAIIGGFLGAITVDAIKSGLGAIIGGASDLNETISKTNTVFGQSAGQIHTWAKTADRSMGMSQQAAEDNANALGLLFTQVGFNAQGATDMSKKWVQLAADLGSFNNVDPTEILQALQGATRGEYDELQRYVPMVSAAAVEHKALAMSGKTSADQLTQMDQILAVQALAFEQTGKAQGDFARTSDGVANASKTARAELTNLANSIGAGLQPAAQSVLGTLNDDVIPTIREMATEFGSLPGPVKAAAGIIAGGAATAAAGAPLWEKLRDKIGDVRDAYQGLGRLGKITSLSLGGLGVALTIGTAIWGAYAKKQAEAKQKVEDLKGSLDEVTGAVTANTRVLELQDLRAAGMTKRAKELGVGLNDLVSASLGQSDAQARVNAILQTYIGLAQSGGQATGRASAADLEHANAAKILLTAIGDTNTKLTEAQKKKLEEISVAKGAADANQTLANKEQTAADKAKAQAEATQGLIDKLTKLTQGALDVSDAEIAYQQAVDDATQSIKDNGKHLDINTQKGRDNRSALNKIAQATDDLIQSQGSQGASAKTLQSIQDRGIVQFYRTARQMGLTQSAADALTKQYFKIPGSRLTKLQADKRDAEAKIRDVKAKLNDKDLTKTRRAKLEADISQLLRKKQQAQAAIDRLHGKTVTVSVQARIDYRLSQYGESSPGHPNYHRAAGGPVWPGPSFLVGENGPELVQFGQRGTVIPNRQLKHGAGGGTSITPAAEGTRITVQNLVVNRAPDEPTTQSVDAALQRTAFMLGV